MRKEGFIAVGIVSIFLGIIWYSDVLHQDVETIESLIGQDYNYARKHYFWSQCDEQYEINLNKELNEFHGGILSKASSIQDSVVRVYTWKGLNHKSTIWEVKTSSGKRQIIDAIRYKNSVQF